MRRLMSLPYTFVLLNWAALIAFYYFVSGRQDVWKKSHTLPARPNTATQQP